MVFTFDRMNKEFEEQTGDCNKQHGRVRLLVCAKELVIRDKTKFIVNTINIQLHV